MSDDELKRAIEALTARVEQLERELATRSGKPQTPPLTAPPTQPTAPPTPRAEPPKPVTKPPIAPPVTPRPVSVPAYQQARRQPPTPTKAPGRSLELLIGRQVVAWIGAIVILFGVGYFVKYAYDQGWMGAVPPLARCLLAAGFGFLLIGVGEVTYRRVGRLAAVGLFSAGIGTLYLTAYAAFRLALVAELGGLLLLLVVAGVGFGLTWRTQSKTIGVLSVIGGYFSPLLLGGLASTPQALPLYLTMLLGVSLLLSAVAPRAFRTVRYVSLGSHGLIALIWLLASAGGAWEIALPYVCGWWLMTTGEALYAAMRRQSPTGNAVVSLIATAWFVSIGSWILYTKIPAGPDWVAIFTVAIGVLAASLAATFGPGLDTLRRAPADAMEKLALALWLEAGVLLATAIAMQFDGYGQTIGWLVVAVASVELARRLPSRGVGIFGLIVGGLALLRIVLFDWHTTGMSATAFTIGTLDITKRSLLAVLALACTYTAAVRLDDPKRQTRAVMPTILAVLGTLGWMAVCLEVGDGLYQTAGWLVGAAMMLAVTRLGWRPRYAVIGGLLVSAAALKWLLDDAFATRLESGWDPSGTLLVLNLQMVVAVAIVGLGWWATSLFSSASRRPLGSTESPEKSSDRWWYVVTAWQPAVSMIACFLLVALSFEAERAITIYEASQSGAAKPIWEPTLLRGLWFTLLWGFGGLGLIGLSRLASWRIVLQSGTGIVIIAAFVWLSFDTLGWRVWHGAVDARVILNLQYAVGALLLVLLVGSMRFASIPGDEALTRVDFHRQVIVCGFTLIGAIVLWLGSLEIDRYFIEQISAKQTGLSVYWALLAIALILIGFLRSVAMARYVGLGLLGITVLKVFFVDMPVADVDTIYRVLSAVIVGLLLLATSVAYAKFAPKLSKTTPADKQ